MDKNCMKSSYVLFESLMPDEKEKFYLFFVSLSQPHKEIIVVKIKIFEKLLIILYREDI